MELKELQQLVADFKKANDKLSDQQSNVNTLKDSIKKGMAKLKISTVTTDSGITATLQVQDRASTNSEMLVGKLKGLGMIDAIKTIEMPDEEAIENKIFNHELDPQVVNDCISHKTVKVLRVK